MFRGMAKGQGCLQICLFCGTLYWTILSNPMLKKNSFKGFPIDGEGGGLQHFVRKNMMSYITLSELQNF